MIQSLLTRININPNICHGKRSIRFKRYPVETGGDTIEDILEEFDSLEYEDIFACLSYKNRNRYCC